MQAAAPFHFPKVTRMPATAQFHLENTVLANVCGIPENRIALWCRRERRFHRIHKGPGLASPLAWSGLASPGLAGPGIAWPGISRRFRGSGAIGSGSLSLYHGKVNIGPESTSFYHGKVDIGAPILDAVTNFRGKRRFG